MQVVGDASSVPPGIVTTTISAAPSSAAHHRDGVITSGFGVGSNHGVSSLFKVSVDCMFVIVVFITIMCNSCECGDYRCAVFGFSYDYISMCIP